MIEEYNTQFDTKKSFYKYTVLVPTYVWLLAYIFHKYLNTRPCWRASGLGMGWRCGVEGTAAGVVSGLVGPGGSGAVGTRYGLRIGWGEVDYRGMGL